MSGLAPAPARPRTSGVVGRLGAWYGRHRSGRTLALTWVLTRLLSLVVLAVAERFVVGDVLYYHRKIAALADVGLAQTLNEYPTPVVWILALPYGVTGGSATGYLVAFVAAMLALDGLFTWALWRVAGRRAGPHTDFWLLFVLLVGPLSYLRFDVLPAVLAGGALLVARRRPALTGALTGLGAAVKLWPALLVGAFLAHRPTRRPVAGSFAVVGFGLALVSLLAGGWARLVSPLTWQSDRGLQVESVWATPVMVGRALQPGRWLVDISRSQAYEVFGPGVRPLLLLSTLATVAGLLVIVTLLVRAFRAPDPSPVAVGLVTLATVALMTVTNKTLSPQYLLWLGGPMAALLLVADQGDAPRRAVRRLAGQLLALALLTHLVYPLLYDGLLGWRGQAGVVLATAVTALRNLLLVVFTVASCRLAWRSLRRTGRGSAT